MAHKSGRPEYHTSTNSRVPKEIIDDGEELSIYDGKEGITARTRGTALSITASVPKKGLWLNVTHIWATFGGREVGMT